MHFKDKLDIHISLTLIRHKTSMKYNSNLFE